VLSSEVEKGGTIGCASMVLVATTPSQNVRSSPLTMDPDRVRAYLQAACAGLGFDIGEVWWTNTESGASTVAAIGTLSDALNQGSRCDIVPRR
jgi:hypothetical protein